MSPHATALIVLLSSACASAGSGVSVVPYDGGSDLTSEGDALPVDAEPAERTDAGFATSDAGSDAHSDGEAAPGAPDAGEPAPPALPLRMLDGVITPGEWQDGVWLGQTESSDWGDANELRSIVAVTDERYLWIAVRGAVETHKNALVLFIDSRPGTGSVPADLTDQLADKQLDDALSCPLSTPAGFGADFAWGTLVMPARLRGADAYTGFRALVSPSDLRWVDSPLPASGEVAETVCSERVCELRVPLATLGGSGDLSLFGRVVDADGTDVANQTVPLDDPRTPQVVTQVLRVERK